MLTGSVASNGTRHIPAGAVSSAAASAKRRNRTAPRESRFSCRSQPASTSHGVARGEPGAAQRDEVVAHQLAGQRRLENTASWSSRGVNCPLRQLVGHDPQPGAGAQRPLRALVADDAVEALQRLRRVGRASRSRWSSSRSRRGTATASAPARGSRARRRRGRCPSAQPEREPSSTGSPSAWNVAWPSAVVLQRLDLLVGDVRDRADVGVVGRRRVESAAIVLTHGMPW